MKKRFPPIALLLALLAALFFGRFAAADAPDHIWHTFDRLDGIEASRVYDIVQTTDGVLWFATDQGIYRYDGVWQQMTIGDEAGAVNALLTDEKGVWAGTDHGVWRWQENVWTLQGAGTELATDRINDLLAASDGSILAGGDAGVYIWSQDNGWRRLSGTPVVGADHLAMDAQRALWLARGDQLFRFSNHGWEEISLAHPSATESLDITDLLADDQGGMWIATAGHGIAHLDNGQIEWATMADGLPSDAVLALTSDDKGRLLAGTNGGGVAILSPEGWRSLNVSDGLVSDTVSALFQDQAGMYWFGTDAGISRYDARTWRTWADHEAPQERITALAATEDGVLWAGEAGHGLYRLQDDIWQPETVQINGRPVVLTTINTLFADDNTGGLWIGTPDAGAIYKDGNLAQQITKADGLAENAVTAIARTPDGVYWFGTASSGLSRRAGDTWQTITSQDGLPSDEITALLALDDGTLLAGTRAGLARFDGKTWQQLSPEADQAIGEITALAQGEDGAVWIGTRGRGVFRWLDDFWQHFDVGTGLLSGDVEALALNNGRLYIATDGGLTVNDGRTWQHFSPAYGYDIGPVHALADNNAGAIYLGGDNGVMRYAPAASSPSVQLVSVNGRPPHDGQVGVSSDGEVQFLLQGHDVLSPSDELLYLYKLEGVDSDWRMGRSPTIVYPPLENGDYTFRAQVRDSNMNYSLPIETALRVRRSAAFIWLPGMMGHIRPEFLLTGIIFLTLFIAVVVYASWSTAVRWHMRNQAIGRRFNPYIAGTPVRSADMFFGRDELLQTVEAGLANNSLMIYGERRIGKTSLLYRLLEDMRQLKDDKIKYFPVFVDLEGTQESEFFHQLMEGLLDALQDELADFPARQKLQFFQMPADVAYTDRHTRRDLRQIVSYLKKRYDRTPRIVFLLDEADVLSTYSSLTQQQFRRILQDVFARNVGVVISGVHISKAWDRIESPWYNMFVEVVVPPLNRYESEQLMRRPVYGFYEWDDDAIRFVWHRSHGRPHRIQQIAHEAVTIMLDDQRRRITLSDVRQAYERIVFAEAV